MNYKDTIKSLENSFNLGLGVNSILYSRLQVEKQNVKYPCIVILPNFITLNHGVGTINLQIIYVDIYNNYDQILSIQSNGIMQISSAINKFGDQTLTRQFTPFVDQFSDRCCGVSCTLSLVYTDEIGECFVDDCTICD